VAINSNPTLKAPVPEIDWAETILPALIAGLSAPKIKSLAAFLKAGIPSIGQYSLSFFKSKASSCSTLLTTEKTYGYSLLSL
jgi:hypothetical protein